MDWIGLGHGRVDSRSGKDGGLASSPAPSLAQPTSASASRKPASGAASGLSRPRLVKVRKHFGSARVRPAVVSDADDGSGFNPFRPEAGNEGGGMRGLNADDGLGFNPFRLGVGNEGGGMQGLDEKPHGWKPFCLEAAKGASGNFESGKPSGANVVHSGGGGEDDI